MNFNNVLEQNKDWVKNKLAVDSDYFKNLGKGQSPEFLYIGCADSRVTPELFLELNPGDVFVHRNIANVVNTQDLNLLSVIEYAVVHLKVPNIVVCGHYGCGGVKAALDSPDLGLLNPWLTSIKDVINENQAEIDAISDDSEKQQKIVDLNVLAQCKNLSKIKSIQDAVNSGQVTVSGWVFDIFSGELIDLEVNNKALFSSTNASHTIK